MYKLIGLIVILAVSFSQQNPTENDFQSKYLIPNFTANWFKAVEYCRYLGRRLAIIESPATEENLYRAIKSSEVFVNVSTRVWIGANDLGDEGNFHWHATGRRIQYANWVHLQPDNWGGDENCVEVGTNNVGGFQLNWKWNDDNCNRPHYFVCEEGS
ncbi:perlucin-like [Culex pipiens pallens]|uniref:perlucin-like n=1 Tax=Culex pipiens pallens TaxID=42434 RepID=UPI00195323BA|nr:perlucin-like [Culex pipiens pallens]